MEVPLMNNLTSNSQVFNIPFSKTGFFGAMGKAFEEESQELLPFLGSYPSIKNYQEKANFKLTDYQFRNQLCDVLELDYVGEIASEQRVSLNSLAQQNTVTVTTGHQVCFLGGPLYFIYKALHTVKLAQKLSAELQGISVVPVFWIATEDHDFNEVAQISVFGKKKSIQDDANTIPVGRIGKSRFEELKDFALSFFKDWESEQDILDWLEPAWQQADDLKDFTRNLLNTWFGKYGLLVLDADNKALKTCFSPIIKQEIETGFVEKSVLESAENFPADYKIQAHPRPCNFFLFEDGKRYRIDREGDVFQLNGIEKSYTKEALLHLLATNPEAFSPNVLTRPLYQETILPNIAYIGGGGELAYWIQLNKAFENANIPFPQLVLRNSFQLVDSGVSKKIIKLGLNPEDLFLEEHLLVNMLVANQEDGDALDFTAFDDLKQDLYQKIADKVGTVDPTLVATIAGQEKSFEKFLEGLQKKVRKRLKERQDTDIQQISSVKQRMFPNNALQERSENVLHYLAKHNLTFFDFILEQSEDIKPAFKLVYLP